MEFKGKVILLVADNNSLNFYKKDAKEPVPFERYRSYIQSLERTLGSKLIKSYILNPEDQIRKYIWSSKSWRTDFEQIPSPNHQKYINFLLENRNDIRFVGPYINVNDNMYTFDRFRVYIFAYQSVLFSPNLYQFRIGGFTFT